MKKIISFILLLALSLSLFAACGKTETDETETDNQAVIENENESDPMPPADEPQEAETEDGEEVTPEPEKPSTAPEKPSTTPSKPAEKPAETPQEKPAEKPAEKAYSISEVHSIVKNVYGADYTPNVEVPQDAMSSLYGINMDDVEDYIAEQPMISVNIDTFIAIKAKEGKGESVAAALNAYKASLADGAMMYPSNMPKAQAASVVRHGDYVFLVVLGAMGDLEADDETRLAFAKEQVAKGVSAINNYFAK